MNSMNTQSFQLEKKLNGKLNNHEKYSNFHNEINILL